MRAKQEKKRIEIQIAKYPLNKFLPQESVQSSVCLFLLIESDIGSYSIAWKQFVFITCDWKAKSQEALQTLLKIF